MEMIDTAWIMMKIRKRVKTRALLAEGSRKT
jgi:hypothetical protein